MVQFLVPFFKYLLNKLINKLLQIMVFEDNYFSLYLCFLIIIFILHYQCSLFVDILDSTNI